MRSRPTFLPRAALAASLAASFATGARAQAPAQPRPAGEGMAFPTGDRATSVLLVELVSPPEVRVGQAYDYQIKVTNLSKALTLEHVRIEQTEAEHVRIESGQVGAAVAKAEPSAAMPGHAMAGKAMPAGEPSRNAWTIARLAPGQVETIRVRAIGDREGEAMSCIRASYEPSLCTMTRFVKAEIQVAKTAPARVNLCDPIPIQYKVTNAGSSAAAKVSVREELPEGLVGSADGKRTVAVPVGDLAAGQTKTVEVPAVATRAGEFSGRASAEADGGLTAQSQRTTTRVVTPKIAVAIAGPSAEYLNQAVSYDVRVRNDGDAQAERSQVAIDVDAKSQVVKVFRATKDLTAPAVKGNSLTWDLGTILPGEEKKVAFTVVTRQAGQLEHRAVATTYCARAKDDRTLAAEARAETSIATEVLTLPALLIEMVDANDPVKVGDVETYTITVTNQGTGPDDNIKLQTSIPVEFEYVGSSGATPGKLQGAGLSFEPLKRLEAKQKATWTIQAKARKQGDVRFQVNMSSDFITNPIIEQESTRIIPADN